MLSIKSMQRLAILMTATLAFVAGLSAQNVDNKNAVATAPSPKTAAHKSATSGAFPLKEVKGISIGMNADAVTKALGNPAVSDDTSMYFQLSDNEALQVRLDAEKKVFIVSVDYSGASAKAPEIKDVFGPEVQVQPGANGKIYKLIRYPEAGYWVSYSRINLDSGPVTTVTINKL